MELAWETLDEKLKNKIKDKKAVHSSRGGGFFQINIKQWKVMVIWMNIQILIQF